MRLRSSVIAITMLVALIVCSVDAYAQNPTLDPTVLADNLTQGFHADRNYFSPEPWEHFDPVTGNIILTFTDLTLPGNAGRELHFQRTFNNLRSISGPNALSRWTFGFPNIVMRVIEHPITAGLDYDDRLETVLAVTPRLVMADGSERSTVFVQRPAIVPAGETPTVEESQTWRWVRSGEFFEYDIETNQLWMPDGTVCQYDADGRLVNFRDPFNNLVTLDRSTAGALRVIQDLGNSESRTVTFTLDGEGRPTQMEFLGRTWQYAYGAPYQGVRDIETVTVQPTGSNWAFAYGPGDLTTVTTPAQGQVTYEYDDPWVYDPQYPNDPDHREQIHVLKRRISSGPAGTTGGTWDLLYGPGYGESYSKTTQITMPSGAYVVFEHSSVAQQPGVVMAGGLGLHTRTLYDATGAPVERESLTYAVVKTVQWDPEPSWPNFTQPRWWGTVKTQERTITRPITGSSQTYTTTFTYPTTFPGNYHQPSRIVETGELTRTTDFTYAHFNTPTLFVVGLPTAQTINVGGQTFSNSWEYESTTGSRTRATRLGITTTFTHDERGNVTGVTAPNGRTTVYAYSFGQVSLIRTPADPNNPIERIINPDGTIQSETRGPRVTTYQYDALMRPTSVQPPGGTNPILTSYIANGATVTTTRGSSSVITTLDGFGRPIGTVNSLGIRTKKQYDAEGRITFESYPFVDVEKGTTITYDALDRVLRRSNSDNTYNERTYGAGTVAIRDENGRTTTQTWAAFGHPDDRRLVGVVDALNQPWSYEYNAPGSLTKVTAPDGKVRELAYDGLNQLIAETHPESGTTLYSWVWGRITSKRDANLNLISYDYDFNDRLTSISTGTKTTFISYETASDRRQSMTVLGSGETVFDYDTAGRVAERKEIIGPYVFFSRYEYDTNDNVIAVTYPSQRRVEYTYNSESQITKVSEPAAGRDYARMMTYHPSGGLTAYTFGNQIQASMAYDPARYWLSHVESGPLQLWYQNYDGVGNVRSIIDARSGRDQLFTYDALDRLSTASGPNGLSQVWAYDVHGNRQTVPNQTTTYEYDPAGTLRLVSQGGTPFTYDNAGNLLTAGTKTFTYSPEHWLTSATVVGGSSTYLYDGDGWRTRKVDPGDSTYYTRGLTNEVLAEYHVTPSAITTRDYVYAGTRLIASVDRTASLTSAGCEALVRPDGSPIPLTVATPGGTASVTFEGSGCRQVSVLATVTSGNLGWCWRVELRKADTNALVATGVQSNSCGGPAFLEPVTLPDSGEYRVVVVASAGGSGSVTVNIYDVVDATTPINTNGLPIPANLTTPGQNARLPFVGTAGQRMSVVANVMTGSFGCLWYAEIRRADTNALVGSSALSCSAGAFLEPVTLPASTNYVVVVNPERYSTGSAVVQLYDASDVTTPITPNGNAVSVDLTVPGRNTRLPFSGLAGQKMSVLVNVTGGTFGCVWNAEIRRADSDALVGSSTASCGTVGFVNPVTLPADGTYVVVVNPQGNSGGTATVRLYNVVDVTGSITPNSAPVSVPLSTPGQSARLRLEAVQNQRISFVVTATSGYLWCWYPRIVKPDQSELGSAGACFTGTAFLEPVVVPVSGTYTLTIDPDGADTGNFSAAVYVVPPESAGSLTLNDTPVAVSLGVPGQNALLTFAGTQGQQVTVRLTGNTIGTVYVYLRRPDGSTQTSGATLWSSSFNLSTETLATTGTYSVFIDPPSTNIGNISVQVTSP